MYRFIAFGHSHIVAFAKGVYEYQASDLPNEAPRIESRFVYLYDPAFNPVLQGAAEGPQLNPKLAQQLVELPWDFVVLVCGGNEHNVLGIVRNKRPFDFVLSSEPDLPLQPGHELVPEALIREVLNHYMADSLQAIRAFRLATKLPVIQLEPPPPLPNRHVLAYPRELARARLLRKKIAPELIRYKLWRLESDIYRRFCKELDISYVPAPADMVDENGMLAEAGWGTDATHANPHYGIKAMKSVIDLYRARVEEARVS
ncbi:MAG: hypothetical protein JOZ16_14765 [Methylobacteriaceae bacterium]|nr:hypothetical protein [Methylobacteriaceae bacterium]